jgi:hypothetical protein
VVLSDTDWRKGAWSQATGGDIVGRVAVTPLVWGNFRVSVDLNQPVTPEIRVVRRGGLPYLLLTYAAN